MEPVVIPADTSWQQLVYMLFIAALPVLLGYMEKLHGPQHPRDTRHAARAQQGIS